MGRPKEHGEETRERLLETAARLLAEEGAGAVSVRRLADEVGTSTRAIYSLFGSKEGLLSAMYRQGAETFTRLHQAVPASEDPVVELLPLALAYRQSALEQPNLYGLLFERAVPGFCPTQEDAEYAKRSLYRVLDTVRRCIRLGRFPDADPVATTTQMWAMVHGLASLELQGALGPPEVADAAWRGAISAMTAGMTHRAAATRPADT